MIDLKSTISIDFGTTNSSVYIYRNNHSEAVPNTERQGVNQFPSFVEYSGSNIITGYTAWENFGKKNKFVVAAVKRLIGQPYEEYEKLDDKSIFGCEVIKGDDGYPRFVVDKNRRTVSAIEVATELFKRIKSAADAYGGKQYTKAYVTAPANYKDNQCRAIKEAAKLAGLEVLKLITEPTAAAMSWCFDNIDKINPGEKMVVYDFGGGTFDVSLVSANATNGYTIINTDGNPHLGGNDIDSCIVEYLLKKITATTHSSDIEDSIRSSKRKMNRLRHDCEQCKIILTGRCSYDDDVERFYEKNKNNYYDFDLSDYCDDGLNITFTAKDLNEAIKDRIEESVKVTKRMLELSKLNIGNIRFCFLVGGSSYLHLIKQKIRSVFKKMEFPVINPDLAVALGAMRLLMNDENHVVTIEEKIVISYCIQANETQAVIILQKGEAIPIASGDFTFTNPHGNENKFECNIYQWAGEPSDIKAVNDKYLLVPIKDCTHILTFQFENQFPQPSREQRILVSFKLDVGGTLNVNCRDKQHNKLLSSTGFDAVYGGH